VIVKGCKKCHISDEFDGKGDGEEVGNVINEHGSASSEYEMSGRNCVQNETGEAE
jgi:hypothetical protein